MRGNMGRQRSCRPRGVEPLWREAVGKFLYVKVLYINSTASLLASITHDILSCVASSSALSMADTKFISSLAIEFNLDIAWELRAVTAFAKAVPELRTHIRGHAHKSKQVDFLNEPMQGKRIWFSAPGR